LAPETATHSEDLSAAGRARLVPDQDSNRWLKTSRESELEADFGRPGCGHSENSAWHRRNVYAATVQEKFAPSILIPMFCGSIRFCDGRWNYGSCPDLLAGIFASSRKAERLILLLPIFGSAVVIVGLTRLLEFRKRLTTMPRYPLNCCASNLFVQLTCGEFDPIVD
jgi:hypothetical protein